MTEFRSIYIFIQIIQSIMDDTTIRISVKTKGRLADIGRKGQTYEDVIKQLLEDHFRLEDLDK